MSSQFSILAEAPSVAPTVDSLHTSHRILVHSSVARAAGCRSAGPWFKSGRAPFFWLSDTYYCRAKAHLGGRSSISNDSHLITNRQARAVNERLQG